MNSVLVFALFAILRSCTRALDLPSFCKDKNAVCYSDECAEGQYCNFLLGVLLNDGTMGFNVHATKINELKWLAVGISDDRFMGKDVVVECYTSPFEGHYMALSINLPSVKQNKFSSFSEDIITKRVFSHNKGHLECSFETPKVFEVNFRSNDVEFNKSINFIENRYHFMVAYGPLEVGVKPSKLKHTFKYSTALASDINTRSTTSETSNITTGKGGTGDTVEDQETTDIPIDTNNTVTVTPAHSTISAEATTAIVPTKETADTNSSKSTDQTPTLVVSSTKTSTMTKTSTTQKFSPASSSETRTTTVSITQTGDPKSSTTSKSTERTKSTAAVLSTNATMTETKPTVDVSSPQEGTQETDTESTQHTTLEGTSVWITHSPQKIPTLSKAPKGPSTTLKDETSAIDEPNSEEPSEMKEGSKEYEEMKQDQSPKYLTPILIVIFLFLLVMVASMAGFLFVSKIRRNRATTSKRPDLRRETPQPHSTSTISQIPEVHGHKRYNSPRRRPDIHRESPQSGSTSTMSQITEVRSLKRHTSPHRRQSLRREIGITPTRQSRQTERPEIRSHKRHSSPRREVCEHLSPRHNRRR